MQTLTQWNYYFTKALTKDVKFEAFSLFHFGFQSIYIG